MIRKISAMIFMLVMTLVITLKHPVLGYCLCLDAYFTGDCICESAKPSPILSTASCVGSCCSSEVTTADEQKAPCEDCTKQLSIETGDFVWSATDKVPCVSESDHSQPTFSFIRDDLFASQIAALVSGSIRGDPPSTLDSPLHYQQCLPIYLRHSVFRL